MMFHEALHILRSGQLEVYDLESAVRRIVCTECGLVAIDDLFAGSIAYASPVISPSFLSCPGPSFVTVMRVSLTPLSPK